jgi:hypothetical protein
MLSADVFKWSEVILNKLASAFRWLWGALTVSQQDAPGQTTLWDPSRFNKEKAGKLSKQIQFSTKSLCI